MTQVRREPLADQAAELLLGRIRAGEWILGARIPGETTLAEQLGVGRSTVREAVRQLAGRGVLQARQGAGVFVTALDVPEDWERVLSRADIVSVIEARVAVEAEAAALAAQRRTATELRTLRRALRARGTAADGIEAHVDADMAFHRAVVVAAHNAIITELFDGFVPRLRHAMVDMLRLRTVPADPESDRRAHADLVEAIAARDAEAAGRMSRTHLQSLREGLA